MATKQVLESQCKRIESLISVASNNMQILRNPEAQKVALLADREKLLAELERLKNAVIAAEIRNAKKQYFSSFASSIKCVASEKPAVAASAEAAVASANTSQPAAPKPEKAEKLPKAEKADKPAKTKEPKAGSAPAQPPAPEVIDVSRLDMCIGLIVEASKHPDADNLYVEQVDVGEGKIRTVVSGLAKHIPLDAMQKRMCIFMCNLKPAKLKGISSEAMVMCANKDGVVEIISPPPNSKPGDRITVPGYPGQPDAELNPKKKIWEQVCPDLRTDASGKAAYKGVPWIVNGADAFCTCNLTDAQIK